MHGGCVDKCGTTVRHVRRGRVQRKKEDLMEKVKKAALSVLAALAIICLTVGFMFSLPTATAYADGTGSNVSTDTDTGTGSGEGTGEGTGENTETEPTEPTVTEEAAIGETKYPTLQAAIEAAAEEATVTMLKDVTVAGSITITKPINFDLNGYTLTGTATGTEAAETLMIYASKQIDVKVYSSKKGGMIEHATYSAVWACQEAHVTFKDLTIKGATPFTAEGASVGGAVTVGSSGNSGTGTPFGTFENCTIIDEKGNGICVLSGTDSTYTNISVNDSKINAGLYGIVGNGAENKTRINLTNTTITSDAVGIYNPQYTSELTVNGGSITGVNSAIEIRAGELTITGDAKLTATAAEFSAASNTSGTTVVGAALAVSQHTNNKSIDVIIESGTFTGVKAVYEDDLEDERTTNVSMTIKDGAFEGEVESENVESFITGGDFAKKIDVSYITGAVLYSTGTAESERYAVGTVAEAKEAGVTTIVDGYGYKAGDTVPELTEPAASFVSDGVTAKFSTLQAAVTVAVNGETVTLLKDVTENIVVPADNKLTLDLNGNTITSVAPTSLAKGIDNKGDLTITDTSEDQTGTVVMTGNALASLLQSAGTDEDLASLTIKAGNYTGGRLITSNKSSLTIEDGTFTSSATGHSVLTSGTCTVTISGGEFTNSNTSCTGRLISIISTGSHVISGGTFTSANGQVVYFSARNSTLDITGGEFIDSGSADAVLIKGVSGTLTVSGGEFSEAISSDYIEEGIVLIPDADGGYVTKEESALTAEDCVALIDSIGYKTLNDAILAAKEGETVKMLADYTTKATLQIDKKITLDLNGYSITGGSTADNFVIKIAAGGAKITNSSADESVVTLGAREVVGIGVAANLTEEVTIENIMVEATDKTTTGSVLNGLELSSPTTVKGVTINVSGKTTSTDPAKSYLMMAILAQKDVTIIDSNITATQTEGSTNQLQAVRVEAGANLTMEGTKIDANGPLAYGVCFFGPYSTAEFNTLLESDPLDTSKFTTLSITNSSIEAYAFAVTGNGATHGTIFDIENSTLVSEAGSAIYHPQYGEMTVSASTITGTSGIEVRAGIVTVTSGTITATGDPFASDPNGNGSTTDGAAIALVQHTTQLPTEVTVTGGTLNGIRAFYQANLQGNDAAALEKIAINLQGGTYNGEVYSENKTGYITGGQYRDLPAEDAFLEGYAGELFNGYYVVVESGEAGDTADLLAMRLEAQADVRLYAVALGLNWADVSGDVDIAAAYAAINTATSESIIALAKAQAMDAVDVYYNTIVDARAEAIEAIEQAAGSDVTVPTATYAAINGAMSAEEIAYYRENALAEIQAIRSLRTEITAQAGELEGIAAAVERLEGAFAGQGGEFDSLLGDIRAAISAAQEAIESGTSEALQDMQAALEAKIDAGTQAVKDAVAGVMEELTQLAESVAAGDKALQEAIAAGEKALAEQIEAVQGDIGALEGAVDGQGSDLQASIDALESAVGEQASAVQADIDALRAAIAAAQADIDDILASIAAGGPSFEELAEQIAAIKSTADGLQTSVGDVQTAVKAAQDAVAAAQGALSGQIEEADDAAAFTTLYVLVGIALALSAAAVALLVVLLLKRSKAA